MPHNCGAKYAVSTCNGTAALIVGLQALGIGPGDEVIVPTLTFSAPVYAISTVGAVPVFADTLPNRFTIDPVEVERRVTPRTRAILAVHLYGYPVDMDPILDLAHRSSIKVIEDAAEAAGAVYKGRKAGAMGNLGCFSFHNKHIATGEDGMILTDDGALFDHVDKLRNPSPDNRTDFDQISLNFRMSNIQAAVGLAQLERLEQNIARKREVATFYRDALRGNQCLEPLEEDNETRVSFWRYSVLLKDRYAGARNAIVKDLQESGIQARPVFYPMHLHPYYRNDDTARFPEAESVSGRGIDLPSSPKLENQDLEYVVDKLSAALASNT